MARDKRPDVRTQQVVRDLEKPGTFLYHLVTADDLTNAGAILKELFDAHTILIAVSDNTPVALTVAEQRIVGRITSGNIAALTGAQVLAVCSGQAGATFDWGGQRISNLDHVTLINNSAIRIKDVGGTAQKVIQLADNDVVYLDGSAILAAGSGVAWVIRTNDNVDSLTTRFNLGGGLATVVATWAAVTHTGLVLSGALDAGGQELQNANNIGLVNNVGIYWKDVGGTNRRFLWVTTTNHLYLTNDAGGRLNLQTDNSSGVGNLVDRLQITGSVDIAVATWSNVTHTGLVLSGPIDVAGQYATFLERTAPGAGAENEARMYAVEDGGTLTDMAVVFQDGTVDIFAQETTPLDAPIFTYPDDTETKLVLRKDHPGEIRMVAVFPNGEEFVMKQMEYHDPDKIAANKGAKGTLPADWVVEDAVQRAARLDTEKLAALMRDDKVE